jgi:cobaltochelatase CobT
MRASEVFYNKVKAGMLTAHSNRSFTFRYNDEYYLDHHLKQTVERNEAESDVEIYGLGVGLSLTPYYRHSLAIDLSESLSNTVFQQILQMIAHAKRR